MASIRFEEAAKLFVDHLSAGDYWDIVIRPYIGSERSRGGFIVFIITFDHDGLTYGLDSEKFLDLDEPWAEPLKRIGQAFDAIQCREFSIESFSKNKGLSVIVTSLVLSAEFAVAEAGGFAPRRWEYTVDFEVRDEDDDYGSESSVFRFTLE